ncbi:hypothetical protein COU87_01960 [Candidatus Roizmanbacteria bacterium CG10_big_fil_rev_8_21_14_0_10_39_12]|uniref:Nucleotidyl transferase AbiEii/AbiGii toxin family protein n=1 Tax=Candidatus Roizmanbacteria bacterium CG10_big_fil_rev_8_21_14_0_10_39_12 TaxID=1974852 RepID=A0A2M8KPT8_9BACT|nr:MAG: hypothetical protein COU87_01960 [Candidatus Roizmanbacteria bacterium CG10_big_fil_rev_8_21_14_0_10_39_12]
MSKIYPEIFDQERKETFQKLKTFGSKSYLAGGTALALQLGHRRSFDFDLFTPKPIGNSLRKQVRNIFGDVQYSHNTADQVIFETVENISVTFLHYWFSLLYGKIDTNSIPLASISDIVADKAHTIGRRAIWRDYVDVFYVLKQNLMNIEDIISDAQNKFKGEFVAEQFLEQLVYYDDIELVDIDWLKEEYDTKEIKSFLQEKVRAYVKTIG